MDKMGFGMVARVSDLIRNLFAISRNRSVLLPPPKVIRVGAAAKSSVVVARSPMDAPSMPIVASPALKVTRMEVKSAGKMVAGMICRLFLPTSVP